MQDVSEEIRKAKSGLFHTPDSWDSIMEWIERFPKDDRPGLVTAAGMAWNLALESSASRVATEDDTTAQEEYAEAEQAKYDHDNPPPLDPPWWESR